MIVCAVWEQMMHTTAVEDFFKSKSLFDLLQLVVGFTYVQVVRDFITVLQQKSKFFTRVKLLILKKQPERRVLELALHLNGDVHAPNNELDSDWLPIFEQVYQDENVENGAFFQWCGPYCAMGVYFLVHPPLVYVENSFYEWSIAYSISVTILFSWVLTLWYVEQYVLKTLFKDDVLRFASEMNTRPRYPNARSSTSLNYSRKHSWLTL